MILMNFFFFKLFNYISVLFSDYGLVFIFDTFNNELEYCSYSSFNNVLFLLPELILIFSILLYLCFIKNFNSFYFSCLFFDYVIFLVIFLILISIYFLVGVIPSGSLYFYSCFCYDNYSLFCKLITISFFFIIIRFLCDTLHYKDFYK